ncbi:MAG TPA: pyridoxal-dependent decarboxylase [Gemmatimonadales bacterium]|nr:pyridoxal-dependent decarboxylase [Gemmatimonadales bacterium]
MNPDEFRRAGHEVVDWIADYLRDIERHPVVPDVRPGDIRRRLPASPPASSEPIDRLFADFRELIVPGMTHWGHPGFFAYFPATTSPPSILAEMLTAGLGAQCMSWQTSPAATELEQVTMDWLRQMIGLPAAFTGVIQDTASTATLVALLTARERATRYAANVQGLAAAGPRLAVYASRERHSSIDKAVKIAGYGLEQLRLIDVDDTYAMRPEALRRAVEQDVRDGLVPACIVATVGTTGSTGIDPLPAIADIAEAHGAWLHVDAAYAGSAALLPEKRALFDGMEGADSVLFNPHKWMLVNFDCTAYFVRDVDALLRTFSASPEYLRTTHDADVVNYRDWGIQLGRRFRALKLWWVIRSYGVEGLQAVIRSHCDWATEFAGWLGADARFELVAPVPFALVCFRLRSRPGEGDAEADARTKSLLERANATGHVFFTHTVLAGRYTIRMSIGARATERRHVVGAWEMLRELAG